MIHPRVMTLDELIAEFQQARGHRRQGHISDREREIAEEGFRRLTLLNPDIARIARRANVRRRAPRSPPA